MAIIIRDRLTGQAKDIKDRAVKKQISMGNQALIGLGQQKSLIDAQQQSLVSLTNSTLGQVQDNIYRAQRQARADSATLGFNSTVSALREATNTQDMVSQELKNVINQSEQGAIALSGQQSAINKAEVQYAATGILDEYANELIANGDATQDIGRQIGAGITGALTGAAKGLIGGVGATWGAKTLLKKDTGVLRKIAAGAVLGGVGSMGINDFGNMVNTGNREYGTGEDLYNKNTSSELSKYSALAGAIGGATLRGVDKYNRNTGQLLLPNNGVGKFENPNQLAILNKRQKMLNSNLFPTGSKFVSTPGKGNLFGNLKGRVKNMKNGVFKMNPWVAAASAGLGAVVGGITSGMDKKYSLSLDNISNKDTMSQFEDMGLDLNELINLVYNK